MKNYWEMYKQIKPYVTFKNYKKKDGFSPPQKGKITKYYNLLKGTKDEVGLLHGPHKKYRPKNNERKKVLKDKLGIKGFNELQAFPIHTPTPDRAKIQWNKKNTKFEIKNEFVTRILIEFNKKNLIANPEGELNRILDERPDVKTWRIVTGFSETTEAFKKEDIKRIVQQFMNRYISHDQGHWSKWMHGLIGFKYQNQKDFDQYVDIENAQKSSRAKQSKKLKRLTKKQKKQIKGRGSK